MYYPLQQRRGLRDAVVFISFKGKQASDNPLGIAAELRRRGDTREHIWAVNDWSVPVPDGARPVLMGTEDYWDALARSALPRLQRRHAGPGTRSGTARSTCRPGTARR